ncbi:MAG: tRNA-dihydrouridine synthase family protein [Prevotella sp.]|nr:tRNA-dihydrouridine synthase family protein [Prevotella sp.]
MISFAPMEGIGTLYYRRVHHRLFPQGIDRYYTPFLSVTRSTADTLSPSGKPSSRIPGETRYAFHRRDLREIRPAENETPEVRELRRMTVPQILARTSSEILWAVKKLAGLDYKEIDLNLGCPSGTVVKKGGGAGMLADPETLALVLDEVFSDPLLADGGIRLSVKTRLGLRDPEEFFRILPVFNKYPLSEIILHPRVREEQYGGTPHREIFAWALEHTDLPLAWNGDLFTPDDILAFRGEFPTVTHLMLGRGIVSDPALAREAAGREMLTLSELQTFVRAITGEYAAVLDNERQLLLKLKELWFYMGALFVDANGQPPERLIRDLRSAKNMSDYRNAVYALYDKCSLGGQFSGT